jgi:hypothetical protein
MNNLSDYTKGIGTSITMRLAAMTEFQRKMSEQGVQDKFIMAAMLAAAPSAWKKFFAENIIIDQLFTYGRCSAKVYFVNSDFSNEDDVTKKVAALNKAWADVVNITVDFDRRSFELYFTAVM